MRTLVLIHGFLGSPTSWREVERHLPEVDAIHGIALPGHGLPPSRSLAEDFDAYVKALACSLEEKAAAGAVLAGYSMGARVALHLALRIPHRIRAALLLGVDPGLDDAFQREERRRWEEGLQATLRTQGLERFVASWETLPLFASQRELSPDAQERQRRIRLEHDPIALAASLDVLGLGRMPSAWPALLGLRSPPLRVLAGAQDAKFTAIGRRIAALAPASTFEEVPGAGHNLILEAPERVAKEIGALLEAKNDAKETELGREVVLWSEEPAQATDRLALAAADFFDESYEDGGRTIEGPTCSLWLTWNGAHAARHIRIHSGQGFEIPDRRIEVLEIARRDGRGFARLRIVPVRRKAPMP